MESRADKMMRYANMSVIPKAYIADIVTELAQLWVIRAR